MQLHTVRVSVRRRIGNSTATRQYAVIAPHALEAENIVRREMLTLGVREDEMLSFTTNIHQSGVVRVR